MQRLVLMDAAMSAVPKNSPVNRDSGQIMCAQRAYQRLIERLTLPAVALADKDAHHPGLALDLYRGGKCRSRHGSLRRFDDRRLLHLDHPGTDHLLQFTQDLVHLLRRLNELDL